MLGGGTGPVYFDEEGNRILAELRKELHSLKKEDLTLAELQARLNAMAAKIADVLANHLVPAGPGKQKPNEQTTTSTAATTTSTVPTTTAETTTTSPTTTEITTTTGP